MNIIELFEELKIDKNNILLFSPEDIIRVEKQVNVEKRINPDIDVNVANNLILALKEYREELYFIASNRILYSLFSKKNYSRHNFPSPQREYDSEKIQSFINQFLNDDLVLFFDQHLSQNKFDFINDIFDYKDCFPEDALFQLNKKLNGKLDAILVNLSQNNSENNAAIAYVEYRSFFVLLSYFSSIEIDNKIRSLVNIVSVRYNANKLSDFYMGCISAMQGYVAYDPSLTDILVRNREAVVSNSIDRDSSGDSSGMSGKTIFFIVLALIKVVALFAKCSSH
ncbi:hypothetical protein IRZ71_24565 [Flavobacterium sp. ANB]|uniref:hypothetical protein n=1 Tax=unclassified Flavobacterium TaxID=196869 RepID=UPI0012B7EAFD|nr:MULTISPECIES: hypothetical protein [unclassified Flavobacterium]MBF4519525.1 hypothetical protein [Flavobacterium sp. ANB]MTD72395.1 hypothetical protein [Flavobacterium sp. LC2016-13]